MRFFSNSRTVSKYMFIAAAILIAATGCKPSATVEKTPAPPPSGSTTGWGNAPDFTLTTPEGSSLTLSSYKGLVIILDFWATWCPPCREEIPDFVQLYAQYKDQGLVIVGVSLDSDGSSAVQPFVNAQGINYPIVLGYGEKDLMDRYGGITGIPTTFVIDQKGDIVEKYVGYRSKDVFEGKIKTLLGL